MSNVASAPAAHPASTHEHLVPPPGGHCLNCHHRLAGPHCHHCGQAARTPARITGHHLLHELPHVVWHVDHGVIYTIREMLLRPGASIKRYLAGERKAFFSPLSLLLLVGGISAFLFTKLHIVLIDTHQPGMSPRVQEVQQKAWTIIQNYQAWLSILFLPISATVATPLLRRATGYTWAEQLVAAALLSGALSAANLMFVPALAYVSGTRYVGGVSALMTFTMLLYKSWGYAQLQALTAGSGRPLNRWFRGLTVAIVEYLATMLLFGIGIAVGIFLMLRH